MDKGLNDYAKLAKLKYPNADPELPGTGAAGGLGFAFLTFLNAQLESGIKIVLEETRLEEYIKDTDIVITGEGRLDFQTAMGKAPIGVAKLIILNENIEKMSIVCQREDNLMLIYIIQLLKILSMI